MAFAVVVYSHRFCPYTNAALLALEHGAVPYRLENLDPPANAEDKARVLALNKDGTVPVIDLGDRRFTDTDTFLEALDPEDGFMVVKTSIWTPPAPGGIVDRATVKAWLVFARDELAVSIMKVLMGSPMPVQKEFRPKLAEALKKLETHLVATDRNHGKFLFGQATASAADIYMLPFLYRATYIDYFRGYNPLSAPVLAYYRDATAALQPSFAASVPAAADLHARLKKFVPKLPVVSGNMLQHESIRMHGRAIVADIRAAAAAAAPAQVEARKTALARADTTFQRLVAFITAHANYEDKVLWPLFEAIKPGVTATAAREHVEEGKLMPELVDRLHQAAAANDVNSAALAALADEIAALMEHTNHHMAGEEALLNPISQTWSPEQQAAAMHNVCIVADPLQEDAFVVHLFNGPQLEQYVHNLAVLYREADPAHFKDLLNRIRTSSVQQPWILLKERSPEIAALVKDVPSKEVAAVF